MHICEALACSFHAPE